MNPVADYRPLILPSLRTVIRLIEARRKIESLLKK